MNQDRVFGAVRAGRFPRGSGAAWLVLAWLSGPGGGLVSASDRPEAHVGGSAESLTMTVRILDADRHPLPDGSYTGEVTLVFPFIGGALFGRMDDSEAIRKRVRVGDRLRFDLTALRERVHAAARAWRDEEHHRAVGIQPVETRVLRFGTLSFRDDGALFADQTLIVDLGTKETLLLVYVDRACSLRGTARTGAGTAEHVIDFPSAGFHWVRVGQLAPGQSRLSYDPAVQEVTVGLQVIGRGGAGTGGDGAATLPVQ